MATVLVVEDDADIVLAIRVALEDEGYRVLHAADAEQVTAALGEGPDMILLDLSIPGMDGASLARRIRTDPSSAAIPIVVMSAMFALHEATRGLPIDDRLAKPFDLDDLYAVVARWANPEPIPSAHP